MLKFKGAGVFKLGVNTSPGYMREEELPCFPVRRGIGELFSGTWDTGDQAYPSMSGIVPKEHGEVFTSV